MAKVLIIEDEAVISMMLESWIADLGHETVGPASTISKALNLIETTEFDAVILDMALDGTLTYELAETLRARGIPFAWGTGYNARDILPEFRDEIIVSKPYSFDAFALAIETLLAAGPQAASVS